MLIVYICMIYIGFSINFYHVNVFLRLNKTLRLEHGFRFHTAGVGGSKPSLTTKIFNTKPSAANAPGGFLFRRREPESGVIFKSCGSAGTP